MKRKQKILLTMLELVVKQGVHGTTMSQLARETGMASSTLYHYYNNKQAILNDIYRMIREDFGTILIQNSEGKTKEEIYKSYWMNLYQYYISNPLAFKFYEFVANPPIISQELIEETKVFMDLHAKYFWDGTKDKTLKNMNIALLVQLSYGTVVAAVRLKVFNIIQMNDKQLNDAMNASWDMARKL